MVRHLVHHLAIGLAEPQIVFEEVGMAVHVRDDQLLVDQLIRFLQIRIAGIIVDDHFIDPAQPVMMLLAKPFVFHSKSPMRISLGESAVCSDFVHLLVIAHLEDDGEKIEPIGTRLLADLLLGGKQLSGERG